MSIVPIVLLSFASPLSLLLVLVRCHHCRHCPCQWHWPLIMQPWCTHHPPNKQLLVSMGWVLCHPLSSLLSLCRPIAILLLTVPLAILSLLLCTSLTPYKQLLIAEESGAMVWLCWCWSCQCWSWCQAALVVSLLPIGCTGDAPHEQLLVDVGWVLVCHALRMVVVGALLV